MRADKDYISKVFRELYIRKWESKPQKNSLQDFVNKIHEIDPESGIDKAYISRLKNGKYPSAPKTETLRALCAALGVELEEFYPSTYEDKYQYSSDYQDKVEEWKKETAEKCFGLNLSLLYGLKHLIDFDSEFPAYAPLQCVAAEPENGFPFSLKYEREEFAKAAEGNRGKSLFQISSAGKIISLGPADMKYLQMIQKYIVRIVREQFAHHRQELIDSMNEATEQCKNYFQPGKKISLGEDPLPPETLQKIDRWGIYTLAEKERLKITDPPEELPYTAAYKERDSITQIGHDPLPVEELTAWFDEQRKKRKGENNSSPDMNAAEDMDTGGSPGENASFDKS